MGDNFHNYLNDVFYDPGKPSSFSSKNKIWAYIKSRPDKPKGLTLSKVAKWLKNQDTAVIFKQAQGKIKREKIVVSCRDEQWSADLMDMTKLKNDNHGISFLLVVIDIFSKFLWVEPLKDKKALSVKLAFINIFQKGRVPQRIWVDAGTEFNNNILKQYFKSRDIHMFIARSESKSIFAERVIKTLKTRLHKYMYYKQTYTYAPVLSDLVNSYNKTYHSSIQMPPNKVNKWNEFQIYMKHYYPVVNINPRSFKKPSFKQGDLVRITHSKGKFTRAYHEKYSEELFKINFVVRSIPYRYVLEDTLGEIIKGTFYEKELILVQPDENRVFKINKVIRYNNRKKLALVSWYGYSDKFNSWIPSSAIKTYS